MSQPRIDAAHPLDASGASNHPLTVGVVLTVYNGAAIVTEAVRSLQGQTYESWRCVIVDDGSTDGTARVVDSLANTDSRITVRHTANGGVGAARNTGMGRLPPEVDLIGFMDHDDIYLPEAFSTLVSRLAERPDAIGVFGLAEYIDDESQPLWPGLHPRRQLDRRASRGYRLKPLTPTQDTTFDDIIVYNPIWPPATALFRHSAVEAIGTFTDAASQQDVDFYVRLTRKGPLAIVPRQVAWYRRLGVNVTDHVLTYLTEREDLLCAIWSSPDNTPAQRRVQRNAGRRLRASEVSHSLQALRASLGRRDVRAALLGVIGTLWVAATVLMPSPPRPSARRLRWSRDIDAQTLWDVSTF